LCEFSSWFWEGDPAATDEEARECLTDRFGDDEGEIEHYLPSVVRAELCPDDMDVFRCKRSRGGKQKLVHQHALSVAALRRLQRFTYGPTRRVCRELEKLSLMLRQTSKSHLFNCAYQPRCAYATALRRPISGQSKKTRRIAGLHHHITACCDTDSTVSGRNSDGGAACSASSRRHSNSALRSIGRPAPIVARPPAATLTVQNDARVGELLDSHYEYLSSAGDGSTYYGFVPFASSPDAIRKQYADWAMGLSIIGQLDRVIASLAA
jgi:hypothetical protein